MIVVADSSPLSYLLLIGEVDLLGLMYGRIILPSAVVEELSSPAGPASIAAWARALPDWIEVRHVDPALVAELASLDPGEAEAILLAEGLKPDVVLVIDERKGRKEAARRGLRVTGTLGVLSDGAGRGLLDLPSALERLARTTFRADPALIESVLERHRQRRS